MQDYGDTHHHGLPNFTKSYIALQHIYVRAESEKERQKWLIALGSSKACLQQNGGGGGGGGGAGGGVKRTSSPLSSNGIQVKVDIGCDFQIAW